MKKTNKFKWLKRTGIILTTVVALLLIVPLFIPVEGASGLKEPEELIGPDGAIVTVPFEGTDGIDTYYIYKPAVEESDKNFYRISFL